MRSTYFICIKLALKKPILAFLDAPYTICSKLGHNFVYGYTICTSFHLRIAYCVICGGKIMSALTPVPSKALELYL